MLRLGPTPTPVTVTLVHLLMAAVPTLLGCMSGAEPQPEGPMVVRPEPQPPTGTQPEPGQPPKHSGRSATRPKPTPARLLVAPAPGEPAAEGPTLPIGWSLFQFGTVERKTQFGLEAGDDGPVVRAEADRAAAAIRIELDLDARTFRTLRWSWKVEQPVPGGDMTTKRGDDCAARVMVLFKYDSKLASFGERLKFSAAKVKAGRYPPYRMLCYSWTARPYARRIFTSAARAEVAIVALRQGPREAGAWRSESVDLLADYRAAFGDKGPPPIEAIALMTDTDDTQTKTRAWYRGLGFDSPAE